MHHIRWLATVTIPTVNIRAEWRIIISVLKISGYKESSPPLCTRISRWQKPMKPKNISIYILARNRRIMWKNPSLSKEIPQSSASFLKKSLVKSSNNVYVGAEKVDFWCVLCIRCARIFNRFGANHKLEKSWGLLKSCRPFSWERNRKAVLENILSWGIWPWGFIVYFSVIWCFQEFCSRRTAVQNFYLFTDTAIILFFHEKQGING